MNFKILFYAFINIVINKDNIVQMAQVQDGLLNNELSDHTMVTDSEVFPYVVAILEKSRYISAGALINDNWVLTAGNTIFQKSQSIRTLRVRLGSINYKKGGLLLPIKSYEVHPLYDERMPEYDIALILLAEQVRFKPSLSPIRMQQFPEEIMVTHFIVNAWPYNLITNKEDVYPESFEMIKRRRMLTVSHLHPSNKEYCREELWLLGITNHHHILCLDPPVQSDDSCKRDIGAPVVLNGILWGIISSWKPKDCDVRSGYIFVTLVSAANVSTWIHAAIHGHKWNYTVIDEDFDFSVLEYDNDI